MEEEVKKTVEILRKGGVILYPTDTVWGIGCDATNEAAVKRIYEIKRRADEKSMLVLVDNAERIGGYVKDVPSLAYDLAEMSEKPLTIIYSGAKNLAQNLIAPDGSIGIRITSEAFSKAICYRLQKPIVSTSANISGEPTAAIFPDISDEIKNAVDYIVRYRQNDKKKSAPSSIIKFSSENIVEVIRK